MKKNRMMRLASVLLVMVLLTTSVISGTFAKYTTTGNAEVATARVAKWGVKIEAATAKTTFAKVYATDDTNLGAGIVNSVENNTNAAKLVAPGTDGTLAEVTITGKPEVAVSVTYDAEVELTGWEIDGVEYCPLVFYVGADKFECDGVAYANIDAMEQAIEGAIEGKKATYGPNTDLNVATVDDVEVTWRWAFDEKEDDRAAIQDDVKDTALGNLDTAPIISISVTTTVEQVN